MKVLLVRTDSQLGDTIFETCFYRELKRHFPDAYITVMACGNRRVLENLPYIDEFIWLPPKGLGRILRAFCALPYIWRQNYDVLVSLTPTLRMKIFNRFLRARRKFPFEYRLGIPAVNAYVNILNQLGAQAIDASYTLVIPPQAQQEATAFLTRHQLTHTPYLVFNPMASCVSYTLTPRDVLRIVRGLRAAGLHAPVVVLDYKKQYPSAEAAVYRFESNDVLAVAQLVKQSAYVLTVDTAISHMAATFNKPMTVLFTDQPRAALPRAKNLEHLISFAPATPHTAVLWAKHTVRAIPLPNIVRTVLAGWSSARK
ncbi:MAG: glycosyltransferase family 9 protein [Elusimicrobiaceae bacterium]|nr:glycosyltransferase family 9 protein [Elusimicrobiaceae bacterium]